MTSPAKRCANPQDPAVDAPKRIQLQRTEGWRKPEGAITVARPSRWGNPFAIGRDYWMQGPEGVVVAHPVNAEEAVAFFRWYVASGWRADMIRADLVGHDLACWCRLDQPCHADVLLELANA